MTFAVLAIGAAAQVNAETRLRPSLVAESIEPAAGQSTRIAIRMNAMPGWHGYWLNPGDVGMPLKVEWAAPAGVRFGDLAYPAPSLLRTSGLLSYVLPGDHYLTTYMTLPKRMARGTAIPIVAQLSWLACSESACTAERGEARLTLEVGDGSKSDITGDVFVEIDKEMPRALAGISAIVKGRGLRIALPLGHRLNLSKAHIFFADQAIPTGAEQTVSHKHGRDFIDVAQVQPGKASQLQGVISDGEQAWSFSTTTSNETAVEAVSKAAPSEQKGRDLAHGKTAQAIKSVVMNNRPEKDLHSNEGVEISFPFIVFVGLIGALILILMTMTSRFKRRRHRLPVQADG